MKKICLRHRLPILPGRWKNGSRTCGCTRCVKDYETAQGRPQRLAWKRRHYLRRVQVLAKLKARPCMDCGRVDHFSLMDFDHRPRTKKGACVAKLMMNSFEKMLAEMDKCDLVCVRCHRIRTWNRAHPNNQIK